MCGSLFVCCLFTVSPRYLVASPCPRVPGTGPVLPCQEINPDNAPGVWLVLALPFSRRVPTCSIYCRVCIKEPAEELCTRVNHLDYQAQLLDQRL